MLVFLAGKLAWPLFPRAGFFLTNERGWAFQRAVGHPLTQGVDTVQQKAFPPEPASAFPIFP